MDYREYTNVDRTGWPSGEWDSEPDKVQWQDEATKLPCLAVRNPRGGNWCGYVGLAEGHPLHGKHYDDDGVSVDVHGGLTFSDFCADTDDESKRICHVPGDGEPKHVWWLGFDCAHCDDFSPQDKMHERDKGYPFTLTYGERYRTLAYVKQQCESLAGQLKTQE